MSDQKVITDRTRPEVKLGPGPWSYWQAVSAAGSFPTVR
jgi:hypothetical protein